VKCPYCHQPIIQDIQAIKPVEVPEGTIFVHETPCEALIKRQMERNEIFSVLKRLSPAVLILAFLIFAISVSAEEKEKPRLNEKAFKQGCICTGESYSGDAQYDKVLAVAETPGGSEYWVFYPEDLEFRHRRSDGSLMALLLSKDVFLPRGQIRQGKIGPLRCPETMWGGGATVTAER